MSRVIDALVQMHPPAPMADQRAARRKAMLAEESEMLSIEQIKQELETARTATRKQSEVSRIMASPDSVEQKVQRLTQVGALAEAEALRNKFNADQLAINPNEQQTPELKVGAAQLDPRGPTGAIAQNLDGTGAVAEPLSPEAMDRTVAMPATPRSYLGVGGQASQVPTLSAKQVRDMNAREVFAKLEEQARLGRETSAIARRDASQLKRDEMELAAQLRPEPVAPQGAAVIQEYNFYADQETKAGRKPISFDAYQERDANRKRPLPQGEGSSKTTNQAMTLANRFNAAEPVKEYRYVRDAMRFAEQMTPKSTDDIGLIYAFAKAMDPGSVVREGEYATVQKYAQSWAEAFGFKAARVFSNQPFLSETARKQLKETLLQKAKVSERGYKQFRDETVKQFKAIGEDPATWMINYGDGDGEAPPPPPAAARPRASDGKGNFVEWDGKAWVPAK